ncbi:MAG: patatin-like phospholipase family protein [Bacteroidaceae bacterium]|nr:patatin-like phospholipase family protein [Bacteroidaceae bacterium]
MKRLLLFLFLLATIPLTLCAQSVGLVMSGGGARGLAHIGVIKMLEENNIPIDYVAGTSMGAIVAALYSMGYTPDEMIELMTTDDFQRWYTGTMDQKYMFYFKKNKETPDLVGLHFDLKDSLSIVKPSAHLIKSAPMNIGFMEIFAGSTAACGNKFDNLMVPFRCVAADAYNKKQIVFSEGDLGDAVRASMSYPFFFKPIKVDSVLLYDGGLYNNFPRDVMERDFKPDIIIGSVVSNNPTMPDARDVMSQAENLIMGHTDYTLPKEKGILIDMQIKGVNLLDFHKINSITNTGYEHARFYADSIRRNVKRRVNAEVLAAKRKAFRERVPELVFNNVVVHGVTKEQEKAIAGEFYKKGQTFTLDECRKGFYGLMSGDMIDDIIPRAVYNEQDSAYTLHLDVTLSPHFTLKMGGAISTSISNQLYFGLHYRMLRNHSMEFVLDGHFGKVYNNVQLSGRIDFNTSLPVSLKFIGSYSTIDYYNMSYLFSKDNSVALNHQREYFAKMKVMFPFLNRRKAEIGVAIGNIKDEYIQSNIVNLNDPRFDINETKLFSGSIRFEGNTLNKKVFPTEGMHETLIAQFVVGNEAYKGEVKYDDNEQLLSWLQINYTRRDNFKISDKFTLGTYLQLFYSTRRLSRTYQATMMQAAAFTPTMNSIFNYDPKFRANQFVAGGVIPIFNLNSYLQIRPGFYAFVPYRKIQENSDGTAFFSKKRFNDFQYIIDLTLATQFSNISASAFVNYYSSHNKRVNFGISLGWFMFNERFFE